MSNTRFKPIHIVAMLVTIAVAVTAGELIYKAEAQQNPETENAPENITWSIATHPMGVEMIQGTQVSLLNIDGSVNITEQVVDQIMSSAEVSFSEAATIAADSVNDGKVLNGNLGVIEGFLVYSFSVVDDDNRIYSVIIDAGNGEVLHTSEPMDSTPEAVVSSIMGGSFGIQHSFAVAQPHTMTYKIIDKAEIEEDNENEEE